MKKKDALTTCKSLQWIFDAQQTRAETAPQNKLRSHLLFYKAQPGTPVKAQIVGKSFSSPM